MTKWTESEETILTKLYGRMPVRDIQLDFIPDRTIKAIQVKASMLGLSSTLKGNKYTPTQDARYKKYDKLETLWNTLVAFQEASLALSTRVDHTNFVIDTDEPVALSFVADAHIGAITCHYDYLWERFESMSNTEGLYLISVGDTHDNYKPQKHGSGMFGQIVPPALQKQLVEHLYSKMKGRWVAAIQGCHEEWSHDLDDYDWTSYLAKKIGCANLGFGGRVTLSVGDIDYEIMARHKYRFNSSFNLTHTIKRMREQLGDFDIGCIAHHHQATIEQAVQGDGVDRLFIRPGSFKGADRWARSIGYTDTGAYIPTVILYPDKRQMIPFLHLEQAQVVLKSLRE